ncbi:hypothetical protein BLNAU_20787 [Blattamonas nauphoetae]|uniref:Uncharacterized protein n=1 Tax=Blattamonas nauphoetae TaxID=2049346 RepID=A0ABQ9X0Z7_9EUKA|nr:hypothetical protein BLNAU_20787 [Blattamonas nauphoetae]
MCTSFQLLHFTFHSHLRWMGAVFFACHPSSFSPHFTFLHSSIPHTARSTTLIFTELAYPQISPHSHISTSVSHTDQRSISVHPLHSSNYSDGDSDRFCVFESLILMCRVSTKVVFVSLTFDDLRRLFFAGIGCSLHSSSLSSFISDFFLTSFFLCFC